MEASHVTVYLEMDEERERAVLDRIQRLQDKLKEAKSLADELASSLSELKASVNIKAD
ncbi:MAG: hypothetical protein IKP40_08800 [Clostridia bacterium]|nr:hypothetical protein [Clostridia bacterium]